MNGRLRLVLLLVALSLVLAACGGGGGDAPPGVTVAPPTGLTASAGDGEVLLSWTASTTEGVVQYNIRQGTSASSLAAVGSVDGDTVSYRATGLNNGSEYFFDVEAEDSDGNLSARTAAVSATPVAVDPAALRVQSVSPSDGSTGIGTNSNVSVTFSAPMDEISAEAAFSIDPAVNCTFSWAGAGTRMTCDPVGGLAPNETYTVTVGTGAMDRDDNNLPAERIFSFTTGTGEVNACVFGTSVFGGCTFGP